MAQDFAKHGRKPRARKAPARKKQTQRRADKNQGRSGGWRLYFAGVATGIFASFLTYLGTLPPPAGYQPNQQSLAEPEADVPKPRFTFYELLPKQTIEPDVEPAAVERAADVRKPETTVSTDLFLLQAGSFRQRDDADQRRAELLLLGLEPRVEEAVSDNGRWFRVYLGPFESHSAMTKARSLTANQNIETLPLKRKKS